MKNKKPAQVVPTHQLSEELREVYYLVGKYPLHKLVPSGYLGSPGFAENGTFVRGDEGKHLSVTCGVRYDWYYMSWYCFVQIIDADDLIYDYNRPFLIEEWNKTLELYNALYIIDSELLSEFRA